MKNIAKLVAIILSSSTMMFAQNKTQEGIFAEINTTKGKIITQLEYQKTPITAANFISLAEGKNPKTSEKLC